MARSPLLQLQCALTWLFEPASLITLPLGDAPRREWGRRPVLSGLVSPNRRAIVALAVVAGLVDVQLDSLAELRLKRAVDSNDPRQGGRAIDPLSGETSRGRSCVAGVGYHCAH